MHEYTSFYKSTIMPNLTRAKPYAWMPPEVGNAFLYTPLTAIPLMLVSTVAWDYWTNGIYHSSVGFWLGSTILLGVPLNYAALILIGIPACRVLLRRQSVSAESFVLVGSLSGFVVAFVWPFWLNPAWMVIGILVGSWNGGIIGRAATRSNRGVGRRETQADPSL
jgi:hypothetical protein